jgi:hypothetical protein
MHVYNFYLKFKLSIFSEPYIFFLYITVVNDYYLLEYDF